MEALLRIFFPSLAPVYAAGKRYTRMRAQQDIRALWLTLWVFGLFYLVLLNVAAYTEHDYWKGSWLFLAIIVALPHSFAIFKKVFVPAEALTIIFRAARRGRNELIASIPNDVERILRYLSAVFAAELVCVLIVYWIPFYAIPEKIPIFDLAAFAVTGWACWTATGEWWKKVVKYVSVGSFVAILLSFFIALSPWATGYVEATKGWWTGKPQQVSAGSQSQQGGQAGRTQTPTKEEMITKAIIKGEPVPHGAKFGLNPGAPIPVVFQKEGFYLLKGKAWFESPVPVEGNAGGQRRFLVDAEKYANEHGSRAPCYYEEKGEQFEFTFQPEGGSIEILTRAAGSKACSS